MHNCWINYYLNRHWFPTSLFLDSLTASGVSLSLSHSYPGSGVVLDCIDSWSLHPYYCWLLPSRKRMQGYPACKEIKQQFLSLYKQLNDIRFLTIWYVQPANAQTSLRISAIWSEPLLVAWINYHCYVYTTTGSIVVDILLIVTPIVGVCGCSMYCCALLYVHSSFSIVLVGKGGVALLGLSSWCLVIEVWLFFAVPWVCLWLVIVVFPDHTHLLF